MVSPHSMKTGRRVGSTPRDGAASKYATWGSDGGAPTRCARVAEERQRVRPGAVDDDVGVRIARPSAQCTVTPSSSSSSRVTWARDCTSNRPVSMSAAEALVRRQHAGLRLEEGGSRRGKAGKACLRLPLGDGLHRTAVVGQRCGERFDRGGVAEAQLSRDVEEPPPALLLELAPQRAAPRSPSRRSAVPGSRGERCERHPSTRRADGRCRRPPRARRRTNPVATATARPRDPTVRPRPRRTGSPRTQVHLRNSSLGCPGAEEAQHYACAE